MRKRDLEFQVDPVAQRAAVPELVLEAFRTGVRGQESVRVIPEYGDVVECTAAEDKARQEYLLSSDLAYQVQRFGVGQPFRNGVVDFDNMDLTTAMGLIEQSQAAWLRLPKVVRDRYQSWANVERAAQSGELEQVLNAAGASGVGLPDGLAASPSDSAGGGAPKGA